MSNDSRWRKNFVAFFLLFFLSSCGKSQDKESIADSYYIPENVAIDTQGEVPNDAITFDTKLSLINFSAVQEEKIEKAAELVRRVIATKEFRNAVLNHRYNGKLTFVDNQGLTNTQIYLIILKGAERLQPARNNAMDAELELYYADNGTIGYTTVSSRRIWMNTKFFNTYRPDQVAGNVMHEWLHKLGFTHSSTYNAARPYSVPYAIGYIIRRLAYELNMR